METLSRRRLLEAGVAGAAVSLAGCTSLGSDDGDATEPKTVTVAAGLGDEDAQTIQQEAQATNQEIQQQLEAGEINETEAQQRQQEAQIEAQEAQQELVTEAVEAIETHVEDTDGLTLEDSAPQTGILLVEGDPDAVVGLLDLPEVNGLLEGDQFEELQQPAI